MFSMETEKPYSLETENRGSYLYAIIGGLKVTPEAAKDYWAEIVDECKDLGLSKVLAEKNFPETISMDSLATDVSPYLSELMQGFIVAFVDRFGHEDISELGKKLARSSGVKMQVFEDVGEAEKWLLAN
jgi:hypothetical protein